MNLTKAARGELQRRRRSRPVVLDTEATMREVMRLLEDTDALAAGAPFSSKEPNAALVARAVLILEGVER